MNSDVNGYISKLKELNEKHQRISKSIAQLEGAEKEIKRSLQQIAKEAEEVFGTSDLNQLRQMAVEYMKQIEQQTSIIEKEINEIDAMIREAEHLIDSATPAGGNDVF